MGASEMPLGLEFDYTGFAVDQQRMHEKGSALNHIRTVLVLVHTTHTPFPLQTTLTF